MANLDTEKLKKLLQSFYHLTGLRIVIFDNSFHEILGYPFEHCSFCSLIRSNETALQKCFACDEAACKVCQHTNELYLYTCHAGLSEVVSPIYYNNTIIAYLMFGQICNYPDKDAVWPFIRERCKDYAIDIEALKQAFFKKQYVSVETLHAAANIIEACTAYIHLSELIRQDSNDLPSQINQYIISNLDKVLTADSICQEFHISHSRLYRISEQLYGCSIGKQIKKLRIQAAQKLLRDSDLNISEIATRIGIYDYNYFTKYFKQATGVTPSLYRASSSANTDL
ncbi:PocR ligand-binding domain-containing protein [Agathobaculum sp. Marseille-P7918]|uniref:PocR ligand-binding domain-containing protein n=1 Tax=Agathobaculum sp. Marseille-P7918 TaxID=2479843 RepID=UPI000F63B474|nr:PocR ligand-binding domain-containing protein [Agathobaculum sp. Marseille-P7918]